MKTANTSLTEETCIVVKKYEYWQMKTIILIFSF